MKGASTGSVVTIGETMVRMSSRGFGPLPHSDCLDLGVGGAESNVAIGVQRLGVPATWIGKVGCDPLGDLVVREIAAEGVRVLATRDDEAPTSLMIKERRTPNRTSVWYYRRGNAGSRLRTDEIDLDEVKAASVLHVTGISLALSDTLAATIMETVAVARSEGVAVSFDLNYRSKLWSPETASAAYGRIIPLCDVVFAGEHEAYIALGEDSSSSPIDLAVRIADMGPTQAVIKLGERGAVARAEGASYEQLAIPIDPVDTVGAGDAFVAGYLAELACGRVVQQRLLTAVTTGAYACLNSGDWEGLPRRDELHHLAQSDVSR